LFAGDLYSFCDNLGGEMHLCFSITAHGFGHGAISCSVINTLMKNYPQIKISIMTSLSHDYLTSRLVRKFEYIECSHDFGMLMYSAIEVDAQASSVKYQELYNHWQTAVNKEKVILKALNVDCVISNISPITLQAAQELNIITASVAPFNWAQIYAAYCLGFENSQLIFDKMSRVYGSTDLIYKPLPSVPNVYINNEINIASISSQPEAPSNVLLDLLPENTHNVGLIALGGLAMPLKLENWPVIDGWHWVVDQKVDKLRGDMSQVSALGLPFLQLVANSDLILTKPGYGTYCEIAAIAKNKKVRVISLDRADWPETPFLNQFLAQRVPFMAVNIEQINGGGLGEIISTLLAQDYPTDKPFEDGSQQLVESLLAYLEKHPCDKN
jgi:hypothetical protein